MKRVLNLFRIITLAFLLLLIFFYLPFGITVSQMDFYLNIPPGTQKTNTFSIENDGSDENEIRVYQADWNIKPNGENIYLEPDMLSRSNANWISISPRQFTLQPDETKEIRVSIKVPNGIEGTYWSVILVEGEPKKVKTEEGTTVLVRKRFAIKVFVTPPGTAKKEAKITNLSVGGLNPLTVTVDVENVGNSYLQLAGESKVEIRDVRGETIEEMNIDNILLLPGGERRLKLVSSRGKGDLLSPGDYLALAMIDYGGHVLSGKQARFSVEKLNLQPVENSKNPPQDLDGDGFYEDINGDGKLTTEDPTLLGFNLDSSAVTENWRAFDFNNDGALDFKDVRTLKEMIKAE